MMFRLSSGEVEASSQIFVDILASLTSQQVVWVMTTVMIIPLSGRRLPMAISLFHIVSILNIQFMPSIFVFFLKLVFPTQVV